MVVQTTCTKKVIKIVICTSGAETLKQCFTSLVAVLANFLAQQLKYGLKLNSLEKMLAYAL